MYLRASLKEYDSRNGTDAELNAEVALFFLNVILADNCFAFKFFRQFLNDWSESHARTAMCSPEINDYEFVACEDFLCICISDM